MNINLELFKNFYLLFSPYIFADIEVGSINSLNISALRKNGIKRIIFDLDSTIMREGSSRLHSPIKKKFNALRHHFSCCILSNNKNIVHDKTGSYAQKIEMLLKVPVARVGCRKPGKAAYRGALRLLKAEPHETAIVTDKRYDVAGAKREGIFTILVTPIDISAESFWGRFERNIENFLVVIIRPFTNKK